MYLKSVITAEVAGPVQDGQHEGEGDGGDGDHGHHHVEGGGGGGAPRHAAYRGMEGAAGHQHLLHTPSPPLEQGAPTLPPPSKPHGGPGHRHHPLPQVLPLLPHLPPGQEPPTGGVHLPPGGSRCSPLVAPPSRLLPALDTQDSPPSSPTSPSPGSSSPAGSSLHRR